MLRGALPALDLSSVLQVVIVLLFTLSGALLLVKRAASRYFVVDASFEVGSSGYEPRRGGMSIGGCDRGGRGPGTGGGDCAACGKLGSKRCSRCKGVQYCSIECQTKHWKAGHKFECKQLKSSEADKVEIVSPGNESCRRRKSSGFSSIALVPAHGTPVRGTCNILQEPKKILFPYDEFVKLFNWDNPGFPPCGLLNCGNSCFANVVLQCLASTRPLAAYLLERDHIRECVRKHNDWCFLCELQVHLKRSSESRHPFSPINILSRLPNIGGTLGYGRQEDAHEFMRFAIDTMQSICLDEFGGEKVVDPSTQETTLIQYIFGGHLQSQVTCTECNMISNRYENMMDLTVEIHGDAESLEECLDQFTTKEWLDGENKYKCDGCNDYVKAWKRLTVHQAPNILTVALKRFQSGRFGKLNKRVTFPENLNLTPYMSGSNDGTDLYQLYAVVVHVDMLNASFFGHYICYTKDYQGRWYRIDDCKVTEVGVEDVLSEGAYMLLYSRKSARTEPFVKPEEPQKKKQLVEAVPKVANSISLPQDTQSSHLDHSLLGDAKGKIKSSDDISSTAKEVDDVDLNDLAVPSHNSIEDLEFCDPSSSSPRAMGLETETSGLYSSLPDNLRAKSVQLDDHPESSPIEIDIDKCLQPCTSYHARNHTVEDTEASTSESDVNMVVEACLTAPMTAKTVVSEPSSGYPSAELVSHVETYSSLDSTSEVVNNLDKPSFDEGNKISPSILESKSSRIAEAASSSCFLCKSTEPKSLVGVEIQNGTHSVNNEIGQSNGYYMNGIYEVLEQEPLDRRNDVSPADLSSISHVFVQNSIKSSDMKKRGPKKFEHHITSFSNGSSEHVGSQIKDDSRSESHYCNGSDLTQTNQYRILSYGSAGENRNGDCKDRPTTPLTLESNGNLASDQDLKPLPEYVIEHIRLNKAAVSYCNEENGSTPS